MGEADLIEARRRDISDEIDNARFEIRIHERRIAGLEEDIAGRRRAIKRWEQRLARLEAKLASAADGAGAMTGEG